MARTNSNEIIAAVDIGTSKIVVLIAEINHESDLKIIGTGTYKSSGLKKGVVAVSYTHLTLPTIYSV